jgi:hypothetical protein
MGCLDGSLSHGCVEMLVLGCRGEHLMYLLSTSMILVLKYNCASLLLATGLVSELVCQWCWYAVGRNTYMKEARCWSGIEVMFMHCD